MRVRWVLVVALAAATVSAVPSGAVPPPPSGTAVMVTKAVMNDAPSGEGAVRALLRLRGVPSTVRLVEALAVVGAPDQSSEALGLKVTCAVPGHATTQQLWSGTNVIAGRPDVTVHARLLVRVPASGALDCAFRLTLSSHIGRPGAHALLRGGWIVDRGRADQSSQMRVLDDRTNVLLSPGSPGRVVGRIDGFTPAPGARSLTVLADLYVTECHAADNFCPAGSYHQMGVAKALTVVQAYPSSTACTPVSSAPVRAGVDSRQHHLRLENAVVVQLPAAGCGTWSLRVSARSLDGTNPFVVSTAGVYSALVVLPH